VLLGQLQHLPVAAVGVRGAAGLDVVEELVSEVGEGGAEPLTMGGVIGVQALPEERSSLRRAASGSRSR
jgi:hypothetical protein